MEKVSRRKFVATAAVAGAATILRPSAFAYENQVKSAATPLAGPGGHEVVAPQASPFPMKNVRLQPGAFSSAAEANRKYLKTLPPDRLLHTFRLTAGLPSSAEPLGEWEKPDCELRGHFAGGHYLSACALAFASSGDEELKRNGDLVVTELAKCQAQHKNGYLSAFPTELFDRLRDGVKVWAPFYTFHKVMAGHLDMYTLAGNEQALETAQKMAGWVSNWSGPLSDQQMQRVLQEEYGGMGEVLANLYGITGKEQYLSLAQRFDKKGFFDPLAAHRDELKGLHVNTHVPQVIAAARLYELTGDKRYWNIASYFWDEVTSERSYCTGGTSNFEHWRSEPGVLSTELSPLTTRSRSQSGMAHWASGGSPCNGRSTPSSRHSALRRSSGPRRGRESASSTSAADAAIPRSKSRASSARRAQSSEWTSRSRCSTSLGLMRQPQTCRSFLSWKAMPRRPTFRPVSIWCSRASA